MLVPAISLLFLGLSTASSAVGASPEARPLPLRRSRQAARARSAYARRDAPSEAFAAPIAGGGSQLDNATAVVGGLGEPLNVIISALSSPEVLTDDGFLDFSQAIGFSKECLDQHIGTKQQANLGDGRGWTDELVVYREDFGDALMGTCLESLNGGNHFRKWRQNGPSANTSALFLAVSKEEDLQEGHNIVPDGYDIGRDFLVQRATSGIAKSSDNSYNTTVDWVTGLLPAGSDGVNHGIAQDGRVAVLTVTVQKSNDGLLGILEGLGNGLGL